MALPLNEGCAQGMQSLLGIGIHTDLLYHDSDVCVRQPTLPGMQGGKTPEWLNDAPVVVGTGVRLERMLSLLLDQHSWQAGDGCTRLQRCN